MSTPPPPPSQKPATETTLVTTPASTGAFGAALGIFVLFPVLLLIAFHVGAGYLSYQKFGSFGWAILDFIFAYFYYPYYAFFLSGPSAEPAPLPMLGGMMKGLAKMMGGKRRR
jgi:uncharacterized RDD family membrane protein YckC